MANRGKTGPHQKDHFNAFIEVNGEAYALPEILPKTALHATIRELLTDNETDTVRIYLKRVRSNT